ncbi:MAG: hypothetical protein EOO41_04750, partial [Methanobacteriota archaeon]
MCDSMRDTRALADLPARVTYAAHARTCMLTWVQFLLAVDWDVEEDVRETGQLLAKWVPIDIEDAIRLLAPDFPYRSVREFAVRALSSASDDDLVLYLLQLVQALRYEPDLRPSGGSGDARSISSGHSALSVGSGGAGVPGDVDASGGGGGGVSGGGSSGGLRAGGDGAGEEAAAAAAAAAAYRLSPLADFLIARACTSFELANYLFWYLSVEVEDASAGSMFAAVHAAFMDTLRLSVASQPIWNMLSTQSAYMQQLSSAITAATSSRKDNVPTKISKLNSMLSPGGAYHEVCTVTS